MNQVELDPRQRELWAALERVIDPARHPTATASHGLYIHGPVGRGKSWVANAFFDSLPTSRKTRLHFHGLLSALHRSIYLARAHRDPNDAEADPITQAIDDLIGDADVLFFDELHVHDSGDARLLTLVLERLFSRGIRVIATSNYAPDDLLPNPLWHHLFTPGIALIHAHLQVFVLDGPIDYRTLPHEHPRGFAAGSWSTPLPSPSAHEETISSVGGRDFEVQAIRGDELWISFAQLCERPTSTIEYLEWVRRHPRWVVTGVPSFADADAQAQQRFINVVDVLADADVHTTFSSHVPLDTFVRAASGRPDAFRMTSRLHLLRR